MQEKVETIVKYTYLVIEKCCNKVLIGKTFCKEVALPSIQNGNQLINLNKTQRNLLQTIGNGVFMKILGDRDWSKNEILHLCAGEENYKSTYSVRKISLYDDVLFELNSNSEFKVKKNDLILYQEMDKSEET